LASATVDAAKRMITGIARRDVIRRFIVELIHTAVPEWEARETFITMLGIMHRTVFPHLSASGLRHLRETVSFQPFRWKHSPPVTPPVSVRGWVDPHASGMVCRSRPRAAG
jgi:hypothetical protein